MCMYGQRVRRWRREKAGNILVCASGLEGWSAIDSFHAAIASSYSSRFLSSERFSKYDKGAQTQMVMCYTEVKERACILLNFCASFVELFRALDVALLEFSGALF